MRPGLSEGRVSRHLRESRNQTVNPQRKTAVDPNFPLILFVRNLALASPAGEQQVYSFSYPKFNPEAQSKGLTPKFPVSFRHFLRLLE